MNPRTVQRLQTTFILLLVFWLLFTTSLVYIASTGNKVFRAVMGMGLGLIVLWVMIGGGLMYLFRERVRTLVLNISLHWQVKFVLAVQFCAFVR